MERVLFIALGLCLSCHGFSKSSVQIIKEGLGTIESMASFELIKKDCDEAQLKKAQREHPVDELGKETDLLRDLFDDYHRCQEQKRSLSKADYKIIESECLEVSNKLDQKIEELNKNYLTQSGVGIQCQTENDNSMLTYITKNDSHAGDDQGDTATHWCRLTYFTKSGGRISTGASSELFTDILDHSLDGIHDLRQVSIERIKIDGLYEWMTSPKTRVGVGAYLAKIQTGRNNTFGASLQNSWHKMNGFYTLENVSDPEIADLPQYGGGVIGTIDHVLVEKNGRFYDYKVGLNGKLELGLEGERFRGDFAGGLEAQANIEPFKGNHVSPYIGVQTGVKNQSVVVGDNVRSDAFYGVGASVGTNINFNSGGQFNFEVSARHNGSLIKNREITSMKDAIGNQGEATTYNIGSQQFSLQVKASLKFPPRDLSKKQRRIQYADMIGTRADIQKAMNESRDLEEVVKYQELLKSVEQRISQLEKIDPRLGR